MAKHAEQRRKQAMERYMAGEKIEALCLKMACSKSWLYKWRKRYHSGDPNWAEEQSRRPVTSPGKIPEHIVRHIVQIRNNGPVGKSALAIRQTLKQQGIDPLPSLRTIYRILHRHEKEVR